MNKVKKFLVNHVFKVIFSQRAKKNFNRLSLTDKKKVVKTLASLRDDPLPKGKDIKKLRNTQGSWRIRIGDLRIIYQILSEEKEIWILDIGFRGSIYKN